MSTLQDLANAIDRAAENTAPSAQALQSAIVTGISRITKLSVQEIYEAMSNAGFENMAQALHQVLVQKLEQRFIDRIVASITPAKAIMVTAGVPVTSGLPRSSVI